MLFRSALLPPRSLQLLRSFPASQQISSRLASSHPPPPTVSESIEDLLARIAPSPPFPPVQSINTDPPPAPSSSSTPTQRAVDRELDASTSTSASDHLFRLALLEDAQEASQPPPKPRPTRILHTPEDAPWTGDEPIETTVLRMLVDKHKPQRSGRIRSSEDKLKAERIQLRDVETFQKEVLERIENDDGRKGSGGLKRNEKVFEGHLVGGDPNHRPWHSTYASPSSSTSPLVKRGHLISTSTSNLTNSAPLLALPTSDPTVRAALRRARKLQQGAVRLGKAREGALDYELGTGAFGEEKRNVGIGKSGEGDGVGGKLEVRAAAGDDALGAGWGSLVELRIERAMAEGAFRNLPGKGKPLQDHVDMANPHISNTDFHLNRIIKRNEALPMWIEYYREHSTALDHLRTTLTSTLHRRLLLHPSLTLSSTPDEIATLRLSELAEGGAGDERSFWEGLVREANRLARRGDGVAPASARRGTTTLEAELDLAYRTAAPLVHLSLHRPPPPPLSEEQLAAIGTDKVRWDLVLPGWWLRWWAAWRRLVLALVGGGRKGGGGGIRDGSAGGG